ncbi:neuroepithelial cell-transforming gene 1 protein isoform X1 [Arapaima gigas]
MEEKTEMSIAQEEAVSERPPRRAGSQKRKRLVASEVSPENDAAARPPLRRGSSFTFVTPGPHWDFSLKRKRREKDDDAVSLCSFDFKVFRCVSPRERDRILLCI